MSVSPVTFACSTSVTLLTDDLPTTSETLTVETALPIARRRVSPTAPVTTTALSEVALSFIDSETVALPSAATVNVAVAGEYPMLLARTSWAPGGTFATRKLPSAFTTAPSEVPVIVICALVTGAPFRAFVTRPTRVPFCAINAGAPSISAANATTIVSCHLLPNEPSLTCRPNTGSSFRVRCKGGYGRLRSSTRSTTTGRWSDATVTGTDADRT